MKNERTGERLTLRLTAVDGISMYKIWLLQRGPDEREEQQWARWVSEWPFDTDNWWEDNTVYLDLTK